jgi:hypothetical protein
VLCGENPGVRWRVGLIDTIDSSRTRFFIYVVILHRKRSRPLEPPPTAWFQLPSAQACRRTCMGNCSAWSYVTVEAVSRARRASCTATPPRHRHRCSDRQLQHLPATTAAVAVVMRPSRCRVLSPEGPLQALPLERGRSSPRIQNLSICDVGRMGMTCLLRAWPSGRPSWVRGLINQQQVCHGHRR